MNKEIAISETKRGKNIFMIDPRNILIEPGFNGRTVFPEDEHLELKATIKANGVETPILVKKIKGTDQYYLRNGERRLRAAMALINEGHMVEMPSISFEGSDLDAVVAMLITNDNVPLNLLDEAATLSRLQDMGMKIKDIAIRTGRTAPNISTLLKLNEAPDKIKELIRSEKITSTLVMQILREHEDFVEALIVIECLVEDLDKKVGADGKPAKITKKDLDKAQGKTNSFGALKKVLKVSEKENLVVREDKKELYKFVVKLNSGKYTIEALLKELFQKVETE
jgi:ParB/RepB/Spo0J family partition protein